MATMAEHMGVKVTRVDAAERYFAAFAATDEPEAKRKIIGRLFVEVSRRIINELRGVSRVVYDISGKPPATVEWG